VKKYEQLIAICISTVLVMAGQGVISPVLPTYAKSFGVSTTMIGATITVFGLARMITNVPAGMLADRRGRRILLVGGPLVTAAGMFGSGIAGSIWVLLIFRFVAGFGSALYMTGATIYLLDIASSEQRGRFIATNQAALLIGVGFGPALGGLLADRYTLSTPFYVVAAAAVLTAVYSYVRLPETFNAADAAGHRSGSGPSRWTLLGSRDFLLVGLVTIGVFSVRAGVRQTLVPLQLEAAFGFEVDELGVLFTALGVIGVVLIWPAGWAADRFGRKAVIVPTATLIAVGIGIVAIANTLPMFIAGLTLSAIGSSITGPAPAAFVADLATDEQRGAAMGLYRTCGDIGIVASPVLSGLLADTVSIPFAIGVNAACMAVAAVAFLLFASNVKPER